MKKRSSLVLRAVAVAAVLLIGSTFFFSPQKSELRRLRMSVHSSGSICMTANTGSIAIAALPKTDFDFRRLADPADGIEIRQTGWSPDGRHIALTWVKGSRSTIALYDLESRRIRHLDAGASSFVIGWGEPDVITIGRAVSFRSPNRLLGPEYEEPVAAYRFSPDSGRLIPFTGSMESAENSFLRAERFAVTVLRKDFEYKLQIVGDDAVVCATSRGYFDGSIGIANGVVIALRHNDKRTLREIVSIDPKSCKVSTIVASDKLAAILDNLKR